MNLTDYLKKNGLTQAEFGLRLHPPMTQMHISHVVTGRLRISLSRALEIEKKTAGEVPASDWVQASSKKTF